MAYPDTISYVPRVAALAFRGDLTLKRQKLNKQGGEAAGESERDDAMATSPTADHPVGILRDTVVALVRRDGPDLSARQLGVFLTCYLQDGAHTVRGLAADLNVSKPAITRALDRLGELDLARRKVDPMDRRSVLVQRTLKGTAFLRDLRGIMSEAATAVKKAGTGEAATSSRKVANG